MIMLTMIPRSGTPIPVPNAILSDRLNPLPPPPDAFCTPDPVGPAINSDVREGVYVFGEVCKMVD
jgi:hypothetical protein